MAAQCATIEAECRRRGCQLVEIVEDADYRAKGMERAGVQIAPEMLWRARRALVVAKLDRLSRSPS